MYMLRPPKMGGVILTTSRHCSDTLIYVHTSRRGFVSIDRLPARSAAEDHQPAISDAPNHYPDDLESLH